MTNEGGRLLVLCSRIFFTPELYCQHDCEHIDYVLPRPCFCFPAYELAAPRTISIRSQEQSPRVTQHRSSLVEQRGARPQRHGADYTEKVLLFWRSVCWPSHLCVCRVGTPPARQFST